MLKTILLFLSITTTFAQNYTGFNVFGPVVIESGRSYYFQASAYNEHGNYEDVTWRTFFWSTCGTMSLGWLQVNDQDGLCSVTANFKGMYWSRTYYRRPANP